MTAMSPTIVPIVNRWEILEPGLLNLQTTKYYIRMKTPHNGWPTYEVTWDGSKITFPGIDLCSIERAKMLVSLHMFELISMGIDP